MLQTLLSNYIFNQNISRINFDDSYININFDNFKVNNLKFRLFDFNLTIINYS